MDKLIAAFINAAFAVLFTLLLPLAVVLVLYEWLTGLGGKRS